MDDADLAVVDDEAADRPKVSVRMLIFRSVYARWFGRKVMACWDLVARSQVLGLFAVHFSQRAFA